MLGGFCNSTELEKETSFQNGQVKEKDWWSNESGERRVMKMEVEQELEDRFLKGEYEESFGELESHLNDGKDASLPIKFNPQFDLAAKFMVRTLQSYFM